MASNTMNLVPSVSSRSSSSLNSRGELFVENYNGLIGRAFMGHGEGMCFEYRLFYGSSAHLLNNNPLL